MMYSLYNWNMDVWLDILGQIGILFAEEAVNPEELRACGLRLVGHLLSAHPAGIDIQSHPLGFGCINVGDIPAGSVRLHIWSKELFVAQTPTLPIHNHIWDLFSYVLTGGVKNRMYSVAAGEKNSKYMLYRVSYDKEFSVLRPTDSFVNCRKISESNISEGRNYRIACENFHSTVPLRDSLTATLVLARAKYGAVAHVVAKAGAKDTRNEAYRYQRRPLGQGQANKLLEQLKAVLESDLQA
jgi:hypothetical protein